MASILDAGHPCWTITETETDQLVDASKNNKFNVYILGAGEGEKICRLYLASGSPRARHFDTDSAVEFFENVQKGRSKYANSVLVDMIGKKIISDSPWFNDNHNELNFTEKFVIQSVKKPKWSTIVREVLEQRHET